MPAIFLLTLLRSDGDVAAQAPDLVAGGELAARVAALSSAVMELAGDDDLLDSLYYGWSDRPYDRATLAVLMKTVSVLQREATLRQRGRGAIDDEDVQGSLSWADDALKRIAASSTEHNFRPHRIRVTRSSLTDGIPSSLLGVSSPPLFAFVDQATSTRTQEQFGDLDLLAALGVRVHARSAMGAYPAEDAPLIGKRAQSLGMGAVVVECSRVSPSPATGSTDQVTPGGTGDTAVVRAKTLRAWLGPIAGNASDRAGEIDVVDGATDEPWSSMLARRSLARGVLGRARVVSLGWPALPASLTPGDRSCAVAALLWVQALDGVALGLLTGWRDLRDGSVGLQPSVFVNPQLIETAAHAALDILRLGAHASLFASPPDVLITVSADAVDSSNDNGWASWTMPVWTALAVRQIRYDLVAGVPAPEGRSKRYRTVVSLRQQDVAGGLDDWVNGVERDAGASGRENARIRPFESDGSLAQEVYLRAMRASDGRLNVALVNLSAQSRNLKLRGGKWIGVMHDVFGNGRVDRPEESVTLDPWQVRLLMAR